MDADNEKRDQIKSKKEVEKYSRRGSRKEEVEEDENMSGGKRRKSGKKSLTV